MRRKYSTLSILVILISFTLLSTPLPSCDANYVNWGMFAEGPAFNNGTHISMPYADVEINITRRDTEVYFSLESEFHIVTNTTQNATLAFAYTPVNGTSRSEIEYDSPPTIDSYYPYNESNFIRIYANETNIEYTTINFHDFNDLNFTEQSLYLYNFLQLPVSFALINLELIANTTMVLSTVSGEIFHYKMDFLSYDYIVGSALTFEGHTMERIHMRVIEELPFLSHNFYPNESLTISTHDVVTDAIWDLNISEFSSGFVRFNAKAWDPNYEWTNILSTGAFAIFIVLLIYQFGYKKSKKVK